jgi:hypothetical protein
MNNSSRRAFVSASVASFAWLLTGGRASGAAPAALQGYLSYKLGVPFMAFSR